MGNLSYSHLTRTITLTDRILDICNVSLLHTFHALDTKSTGYDASVLQLPKGAPDPEGILSV
jgi:hypothetical protein